MKPSTFKKLMIAIGAVTLLAVVFGVAAAAPVVKKFLLSKPNKTIEGPKKDQPTTVTESPAATDAAKNQIKKDPPKKSKGNMSGSTTKSADGTSTTTVSDGGMSASELARAASSGPGTGAPYGIKFVDETGRNGSLEGQIKDFMNSHLKWGSELPYLYQVTIRDAGASGWEGLYGGSYTMTGSGDIISAYGAITLNTYYHQSDPYFTDYMKLVFSHEYGHHFTLYHKWVDWDIPAGQRFPDAYYSARGLSKSNTASDYSLGWANCDAEIIAEDYSYLYSGYGYHAMAGARGYPSGAVKSFIESLPSGTSAPSNSTPAAPPATDNKPTVSITTPSDGATISGTQAIGASAADDHGITKVSFYIGSIKITDDTSSPYQTNFDTTKYANGAYQLKVVAYDTAGQTAESSINVTINNESGSVTPPSAGTDSEKPVVSIAEPTTNPYLWSGDPHKIYIRFRSTDNVAVTKLKVYVNGELWQQFNSSDIDISWTYSAGTPAGDYVFKGEAIDAAGNVGEASVTITKT